MALLSVDEPDFPAISVMQSRIASRLRARRRLLGATLQEVAEAARMNFRQLHKYELAQTRVPAAMLWRLSQVLDVSLDYFFVDRGAPSLAKPTAVDLRADA